MIVYVHADGGVHTQCKQLFVPISMWTCALYQTLVLAYVHSPNNPVHRWKLLHFGKKISLVCCLVCPWISPAVWFHLTVTIVKFPSVGTMMRATSASDAGLTVHTSDVAVPQLAKTLFCAANRRTSEKSQ